MGLWWVVLSNSLKDLEKGIGKKFDFVLDTIFDPKIGSVFIGSFTGSRSPRIKAVWEE